MNSKTIFSKTTSLIIFSIISSKPSSQINEIKIEKFPFFCFPSFFNFFFCGCKRSVEAQKKIKMEAKSVDTSIKRRVTYFYDRKKKMSCNRFTFNEIYLYKKKKAEIGNYYYGKGHPMKPHRIRMAHNLIINYNLFKKMEVLVTKLPSLSFFPSFTLFLLLFSKIFLANIFSFTRTKKKETNKSNRRGDDKIPLGRLYQLSQDGLSQFRQ